MSLLKLIPKIFVQYILLGYILHVQSINTLYIAIYTLYILRKLIVSFGILSILIYILEIYKLELYDYY